MELLDGVHVVPGIPWSRVYLIEDETLTLVDTGPPWSAGRIVDYMRSIGRRPEELGLVLMTHSHPDHTSSAGPLVKRTGARVVAHGGDTRTYSDRSVRLSRHGLPQRITDWLPMLRGAPVSETADDGQLLPVQGGLRVIHTPGHTPGSACFLLEGNGVLFTGDTIFSNGRSVSRSVPFPGYNGRDYRRSLERLATLEFDTLCGGHGAPLVGGASEAVRALLRSEPEPPSWGGLIKGLPGRLYQAMTTGRADG